MGKKLKIIADENIPQVKDAFSFYGNVTTYPGREINNNLLKDADVLLVRSVTKVNEQLLKNTPIKCVLTATTGIDHVDTEYLKSNNIYFNSADGSNTISVVEYTIIAILDIVVNQIRKEISKIKIAVVGYGKIGSRVFDILNTIGFNVIKIDPPLQKQTLDKSFSNFNDAYNCDIVTFHVPLTYNIVDSTYHYINEFILSNFNNETFLINTSRGEIFDNTALLNYLTQNSNLSLILDVWENEPDINLNLLNKVYIGTPHIAGYSLDAKIKGTKIIYEHFCNYFNLEQNWQPNIPKVLNNKLILNNWNEQNLLNDLLIFLNRIYFLREDYFRLKKYQTNENIAKHFDFLRKNYINRREFSNYTIKLGYSNPKLSNILKKLNFNIEDV